MPTVNGTALGDTAGMNEKESDDGNHYATLSFILNLAVDDLVRDCVYHNGSGSMDTAVTNARWRSRMALSEIR